VEALLSASPINENSQVEPMKKLFIIGAALLILIVLLVGLFVALSNLGKSANNGGPLQYTYSVIHIYPHDVNAFTEGLVWSDGYLYESTGLYGSSTLRRVDLATGKVLKEFSLGSQYFGEGITIVNDSIIQLTWQEHLGFVYDKASFALLKDFAYSTEGWGLTYNGTYLIMSDGSNHLYFLNPLTFQRVGQVQVLDGSSPVTNINELEYVNGDVFANIFLQQKIAIINIQTGQIKAWIDLTGIQDTSGFNSEMVLNGIAYNNQSNQLFITGKDWPSLFEIKIIPK